MLCLINMAKGKKQLELVLRCWGGARKGAGRKPINGKAGVSHARRPRIRPTIPAHVTIKLKRGLWNLRTRKPFVMIVRQLEATLVSDVRITHVSVQHDHVHLVVEAEDNRALSRRIQGLSVRIAYHLNRLMGRGGKVFKDRFHVRLLETPREVKHALFYLATNGAKHLAQIGRTVARAWIDPCATIAALGRWCSDTGKKTDALPVAKPRTWLLSQGYTKAGAFSLI